VSLNKTKASQECATVQPKKKDFVIHTVNN